jgi:hypothetical protein
MTDGPSRPEFESLEIYILPAQCQQLAGKPAEGSTVLSRNQCVGQIVRIVEMFLAGASRPCDRQSA